MIPVVSATTHFVQLTFIANTQLVCLERSLLCKSGVFCLFTKKLLFTSRSMNMYLRLQQMDYCFSLCCGSRQPDTQLVRQSIEKVANLIRLIVEGIGAYHRIGSNV